MDVSTKFIGKDIDGKECELEIGKVYEFKAGGGYRPHNGKLLSVKDGIVTFDRSSEFHSWIETHEIYELRYMKQVDKNVGLY